MPQYNRTRMCAECPFRANAIRGWLGPSTPEQLEKAIHGEDTFICHTHLEKLVKKGVDEAEFEERGEHCVGMARYRNSVCKTVRDPQGSSFQEKLESITDKPLIPPFAFLRYHTKE